MKSIILILLFSICIANLLWADSIIVWGTVTDKVGNPLIGSNVIMLNTQYGAATAKNGVYTFNVPITESGGQVTLQARFMGYKSQTIKLTLADGTNTADFQLEEDVLQLKPIIVSAQKRQEDIQKVPISITAITSKEISQRNSDRVIELEYAVPNMRFSRDHLDQSTAIDIRGVGGRSRNIGQEGRAAVYVDGVYMGRSITINQNLFDVEAVEILRGPQGTLFGKNTVSGAICLRTIKPFHRLEGKINIEAGNYNHLNTIAVLNIPLMQNRLYSRISLKKLYRKGFITNLYDNTDLNGANVIAGRVQLRYLASSKLEINMNVNGDRDHVDKTICVGIAGSPYELAPDPRQVSHDADEFRNRDLYGGSLTVDYELPRGYSLKSISAYQWNKFNGEGDEDYTPVFEAIANFDEQSSHFTQEIQLTSPPLKTFDFVSGLYYFYQITKTTRNSSGGPAFFIPNCKITTPGNVKTQSIAGYVNGNWHLTKRITINGGLRYTFEGKKIIYSSISIPGPLIYIDIDNFRDSFSEGVFSPRGGINFSINDNSMIYGAIARAYKSGGWNADYLYSEQQIRFHSEFATNYEFGLKSTMWNNRLRFNAAAFLTKFMDFQVFQFVYADKPTAVMVLTNAGKASTKGFEIELSALPFPDVTLTSSLGFTDATFDEFKDGGDPGEHYDGHKLPWAPEIQFNIALDFRKKVGHIGRLIAHGDFAYTDEYFTNPNNDPIDFLIKDYYLLNARIGFEFKNGNWGIYFWSKNLMDELYMRYKDRSGLEVHRAWYGMPRTYGIQVSYRFLK